VLANPNTLAAMREAIARYVVIDPGWDLAGLIEQARSMSEESVLFRTIPTGRTNLSTPDGDAVHVDRAQVQQFVAQLTNPGDQPLNPPISTAPATPAIAPIASSMPCIN
jgi:hypothetical protein